MLSKIQENRIMEQTIQSIIKISKAKILKTFFRQTVHFEALLDYNLALFK